MSVTRIPQLLLTFLHLPAPAPLSFPFQGKRDTEKGTKAKIEEMGPDGFTASYNMTGKPSLVSLRAPSLTKWVQQSVVDSFLARRAQCAARMRAAADRAGRLLARRVVS